MYWREKEVVYKTLQSVAGGFRPGGLEIPKTAEPVVKSHWEWSGVGKGGVRRALPLTLNPEAAAWFSQCVYDLFYVNAYSK